MTSLVDKLKAGKRNVSLLKYPGTDDDIGITVLTEAEHQETIFAAERVFKDACIEISATTLAAYNAELNTQTLFRAIVDPAKKSKDGICERYFRSVDELRGVLQREAKETLIEAYNAVDDECNPSPERLSEERLEAIFSEVKKNPISGRDLSLTTLRELIIYLASRPSISPKDNGSISSP